MDEAYAVAELGRRFPKLDLTFHETVSGDRTYLTSYWPGRKDEDVMVCAYVGDSISEPFHRQDFFFLNYAWKGPFRTLSARYDNLVTVEEGECYLGQPYSGYGLRAIEGSPTVIVGLLVRRDCFFRDFLPSLSSDQGLFEFFAGPERDRFSEGFLKTSFAGDKEFRDLMSLIVRGYVADASQNVLKPLVLAAFSAAAHRSVPMPSGEDDIVERLTSLLLSDPGRVSLKAAAERLGYSPNYLSALVRRRTGRTVSELVLERRMYRAATLLSASVMTVDEISSMLGYCDVSNFHKAFRDYWGTTPRKYAEGHRQAV